MSVEYRLPQTAASADRERFGFVEATRSGFGFLLDAGYEEVCAEPTYLRFERDGAFVDVFHGRPSYELGVEFGRQVHLDDEIVEQKFHIRDVPSLLVPEVSFTAYTATSPDQVARFLEELARWTKLAVERFERGGVGMFDRLSEEVERQSDEYLDAVRAGRLRAHADDAWHRRDFASVITAYEEIDSELGTVQLRDSEIKRLSYAREHLAEA